MTPACHHRRLQSVPVPGSFAVFDKVIARFVEWTAPRQALDIGTGEGKLGRLLREHAPGCRRVGIEIEAGYVERFALRELYDELQVADVREWWRRTPDRRFDLVLVGDCIEHLSKSEGLDLLNAMVYRAAWIAVVAPEFIVQGAVGGVDAEVHRSVWSERDFGWHDLWAWDNARAMTLLLLRGYQPSPLTIDALVERVNAADVPVLDFDGTTAVRPCRLRLVEHPREIGYRVR